MLSADRFCVGGFTMIECKSVCPYDCPDACGLILQVEDDKLIGVRGNKDHTFTRGTVCQKMAHYEETVHSPKRLLTPMKRTGPKGVGIESYESITWNEALTTIVDQFKHCISEYGSESILRYSYAGTMGIVQGAAGDYLFRRLGSTNQDRGICSPAKRYGWKSVMGNTTAIRPQEAGNSDFIIMWGRNAAATNVHFLHDVQKAKQSGAQVWVVDTYKTSTYQMANHTLTVRPGSDGALALGLIHILERDGLVNKAFVDEYVQGYDELAKDVLPQYIPDYVATVTGLSVDDIERFAHAYGNAKAPFIRLGSGLSRYGNGAITVRAICALPAVVGAWEHVGGGLLSSTSGSSFLGNSVMQHLEHPTEEKRVMAMIDLGSMLTEPNEVPIKCAYIFSSNPAITSPDQNVVRRGLMQDDLFTIVHERFFTDTCAYADIILPATSSVEHDDIYYSYGHYTLGTGYQAIPPVGESRSNWQVFSDIGRRMGFDEEFFRLTERELIEKIVRTSGLTQDVQNTLLNGEPVEVSLSEDYKLQIKTPSQKIEILNPLETEPLPIYKEPYGDDCEFWLINGPDLRILDSSFCERYCQSDQELMRLFMNNHDMKRLGISDGDTVELYNARGSLKINAYESDIVNEGSVVTLGVWWQCQSSDPTVGINVLTASRHTDSGDGSTFYDVKVNIRCAELS